MKTSKEIPVEKRRRGRKGLITIVVCLYALLALSLGQVALAVCLFASKTVESTTFVGEILIIVAVSRSRKPRMMHTKATLTVFLGGTFARRNHPIFGAF